MDSSTMMLRQVFVGLGSGALATGALLLPVACTPAGDPSTRYATPNVAIDQINGELAKRKLQ